MVWVPWARAATVAALMVALTATVGVPNTPVIDVPVPFAPAVSTKYSAAITFEFPLVTSLMVAASATLDEPFVACGVTATPIASGPAVSGPAVPVPADQEGEHPAEGRAAGVVEHHAPVVDGEPGPAGGSGWHGDDRVEGLPGGDGLGRALARDASGLPSFPTRVWRIPRTVIECCWIPAFT